MHIRHEAAVPIQPTDPGLVWERKTEARGRKFRARASLVQHLIRRWTNPEDSAVDLSGGPGRWLDTIAPNFKNFCHLDLSAAAVEVARADHLHLRNVEYGSFDLLNPLGSASPRTWDVVFCLDTLLYRGVFVEAAIESIFGSLRQGGVAILDFPTAFRASISRMVKKSTYNGPERTFAPREARCLLKNAGFDVVDTAHQFAEFSAEIHNLIGWKNTRLIPIPSTWTYFVVTKPQRTD